MNSKGKTPKNGSDGPQDIHPDWLNVVRAAQAACTGNNGYGVMTIIVSVIGGQPVFYEPVMRHKLHPARAAKKQMTPQMAQALMSVMDMYVDEPVIMPESD